MFTDKKLVPKLIAGPVTSPQYSASAIPDDEQVPNPQQIRWQGTNWNCSVFANTLNKTKKTTARPVTNWFTAVYPQYVVSTAIKPQPTCVNDRTDKQAYCIQIWTALTLFSITMHLKIINLYLSSAQLTLQNMMKQLGVRSQSIYFHCSNTATVVYTPT
jgi:hypothetical protein